MTAAALLLIGFGLVFIPGLYLDRRRLRASHEQLKVTHSRTLNLLARERQHHLKTAVRAVKAERALERSDAALVEAGREAATHADHLTAVMDAVVEGKPLTLVRGGRR